MKNIMEKIENARRTLNARYDMTYSDCLEIAKSGNGRFDVIANSFTFGYMQGAKAAKAEMRKNKDGESA